MNKQYIIASIALATLLATPVAAVTVESRNSAGAEVEITEIKTSADAQVEVQTETKTTDADNDGSTERVLPTVNKKTTAKVTVRGWDAEKKEEIEGKIATAIENNPHITATEVAEDSVTVHYSAPARLFGFIPFNMNIVLATNAEGKITVKFPWYKFVATSPFSNIAATMNETFQQNQTDLEFVKAKGNVDGQIQTLSTVSTVLKAHYDLAVGKK